MRATIAALALLLAAACGKEAPRPAPEIDPVLGETAIPGPADKTAEELVERAYALKQDGRNGAALAALEKACAAIEKSAGARSADFGSCLDDEASVHVRMGHADKARALYERALGILKAASGADPRLVHGVMTRLEEMDLMAAKGIACAEPAEPPAKDALPYFPDVGAMQEALGALNPYVAVCSDGVPEAVTVRVIVTG
ncbi:MAG: tetratricopeptide repeat protein, partial [Proteobacteria bacterium]|nr:tetratricopeptide repeat protein [Pseudomonadota bacterium]